MSLFSSLSAWKILENPKQLAQYQRIKKKKEEKDTRIKTEKEIRKEMREKLSEEEYKKWWHKQNYAKKKKEIAERYKQKKKEEELMIEEIYKEVYDTLPEPVSIDKYYIEKYREEDTDWEWRYRYSWWASPLANLRQWRVSRWTTPIRIAENYDMSSLMINQIRIQTNVYKFIYPHIKDISPGSFKIASKQKVTARPMRATSKQIDELTRESGYPKHQICEMIRALHRWVYMPDGVFLWNISWIFGEEIVTSMGHMFKIALENNLPWLTPDNVEDVRNKRLAYKRKWDDCPIYILFNAYLIRVPAWKIYEDDGIKDYWHYYYYVIPMWVWDFNN